MTVRLLTDENIDGALVTGLQRLVEGLDLVRVQDVGLRKAEDPAILAWAADAGRVLATLDARTIPVFAADRVRSGLPMPGVFLLPTQGFAGTQAGGTGSGGGRNRDRGVGEPGGLPTALRSATPPRTDWDAASALSPASGS